MSTVQRSVENLKIIYEKVQADSRFSLYYLRAVDAAIDTATDVRNFAQSVEPAIKKFLSKLDESGGYKEPIDPEGTLASISASSEAAIKEAIHALQEIDDAWEKSQIPVEHAEEVFEGNGQAIDALQKLHDAMVDLRWAVLEHDADLEEPTGKAFDNVEDLFSDLRSR